MTCYDRGFVMHAGPAQLFSRPALFPVRSGALLQFSHHTLLATVRSSHPAHGTESVWSVEAIASSVCACCAVRLRNACPPLRRLVNLEAVSFSGRRLARASLTHQAFCSALPVRSQMPADLMRSTPSRYCCMNAATIAGFGDFIASTTASACERNLNLF